MELLKKLCEAFGPSGCESEIADIIKDEIYSDSMGNLICHKKGSGKKIMYAAHMDEIGLMVTFIEETGYLRCAQIGYLPPHYSINRFVKFENGTVGVVAYEKEHEGNLRQEKVFIDIGAKSREEAEGLFLLLKYLSPMSFLAKVIVPSVIESTASVIASQTVA